MDVLTVEQKLWEIILETLQLLRKEIHSQIEHVILRKGTSNTEMDTPILHDPTSLVFAVSFFSI